MLLLRLTDGVGIEIDRATVSLHRFSGDPPIYTGLVMGLSLAPPNYILNAVQLSSVYNG